MGMPMPDTESKEPQRVEIINSEQRQMRESFCGWKNLNGVRVVNFLTWLKGDIRLWLRSSPIPDLRKRHIHFCRFMVTYFVRASDKTYIAGILLWL